MCDSGAESMWPKASSDAAFNAVENQMNKPPTTTNAAAPTQSTMYYVSAVLTYQVDGMNLAIPFSAETITVEPRQSFPSRAVAA